MPKFTIDGRELEVPEGTTIMQAAHAAGIPIPHYCYHPGLSIAGNCRICLVEVEKFPKPAIACNTVVTDGMVVRTQASSEKVKEWQESVMEFLLINHPLDCPICDQAGECKLQDYSFKLGRPTTRFVEEKEHGPKRRILGPHVVFDWERCIKCTRCIRFCREVTGTGELGMFLRGVKEEIGVFPGRPLENPYSGNVADVCPVGALTIKDTRFMPRVYFVSDVPSVCPGCARGCSVHLGVFRNQIVRITPRENQAINRWWICDEGRLWGRRLERAAANRLSGVRGPAAEAADPWAEAVRAGAEILRGSAGRVAVVASPRAGLEETFLLARLASGPLGGAPVYLPRHERGEDDDLLIRADKSPNRRGVELLLEALCGGARPIDELRGALGDGRFETVLALGPGLVGPVDGEPEVLPEEALRRAPNRIVIDAHRSGFSEAATLLLPSAAFAEYDATYVNFAGRVQAAPKGLTPHADCRPPYMLLADLYEHLTGDPAPAHDSVHTLISETVPAFAGIVWDDLPGSTGADLAGADAAAHACRVTGAAADMLARGWRELPASPRGKPPWVW
ncbi:MAG: NADH-quinone oxidoreductase subunit G [Acidobacteria bacterium]|nr:MAG: NADH-quinone oxidoreductase subunit G [Acidobacteriota bacterium]